MSFSEKTLEKIIEISEKDGVNLFEAAAAYCEEQGLDQDEFIASLDSNAVDQIKMAAINGHHVRRSFKRPRGLPL